VLLRRAAADLDDRPGPARDVLVEVEREWIKTLTAECRLAVRLDELPDTTDPEQLCFELFGVLLAANFWNQLLGERAGLDRAHRAIDDRLASDGPG
jgi:hypothetical protein